MSNILSRIHTHFHGIIGQTVAKSRLEGIIAGAAMEKGFMAPAVILAPPGLGKTKMLEAAKAATRGVLNRKVLSFASGSEMGSPTVFFEDVLVPHVHDKDVMMVVDEFHEAHKGVQNIIRSMVEISTARHVKTVSRGDMTVDVHPNRFSLLIATNKVDTIDSALMSRLERIDLALYSDEEMEKILFQGLGESGITFNDNTLRSLAECNRGSARDVVKWANAVRRHVAIAGKMTVNKQDCKEIIREREHFPRGVTKNELSTLLSLEKAGDLQLKELAARHLCSSAEQMANENYLLQKGFLTIIGKRHLPHAGREYLATLRADGFIPARD